jgi:NTE family protein
MDYRMNQLYADKLTYLDAKNRPFIHLMDGAISDNLGLRSIIDRVSMGDSISALIRGAPPRSVKQVVFVVINSEIVPGEDIDQSGQTPDIVDVATALKFGKGMRSSGETLEILRLSAKDWAEQLKSPEMNTPQSIFTKDSELHVIEVSLKAIPDDLQLRNRLMRLATTFHLPQQQVDELVLAGKNTLKASPEFQKLMTSLNNQPNKQAQNKTP